MRYHHAVCSGLDTTSERNQFQRFQPFKSIGKRGQRPMRVYSGITVTGEML